MTTTTKRPTPKTTPAGESEGEAPDVDVTPPPADEVDESPADDVDDDAKKKPAKKKPKADDKADDKADEVEPAPGFFATLKRFWWDEEIR